nr:hypothetical protein [Tanacetum cinerariifolium]
MIQAIDKRLKTRRIMRSLERFIGGRRVKDLQLSVKSYQKKLNLTKPDTYHSDLKRKEAYIAYSNPRGFIYQNKDMKNRLMRIDELHKFSDGTLTDVNPKGQQYPHNLLKPLPLIPNNRGRRVIPFDHFINNDLEYLRGGASSRKYTASITKTKAADYGHIKWIEDLVPRT